MEFWGAEVKSGENLKVELENDGTRVLHLSQLALGEATGDKKKEKRNENICTYLNFKNEKFLIGTLSLEKFPQIPLDLVLHDEFELSHTWKSGSVYITGYYVDTTQGGGDNESEEELPQPTINLATASDPTASRQVKIVEPKKDEDSSDGEDEDDTSAEDEETSEDQEPAMPINGEKESDDDTDSAEESSDEDQETPEKAGPSKKRSSGSAKKTPAPEKKVKLETPQKTDGKKVTGHTATPHPAKQAKKASAATGQAKQTPKSGGSFPCKSCGRSFGSENALQSHSKAKHGGAAV